MSEIIKLTPELINKHARPQDDRVDRQSFEERTAINNVDPEKLKFLRLLKRNNPINKNSDTYMNAYTELKKSSNLIIADIINNTPELIMNSKPTYFTAAYDILLE